MKSFVFCLLLGALTLASPVANSVSVASTDMTNDDIKVHTDVPKVDDAANPIPLPEAKKSKKTNSDDTPPKVEYDIEKLPAPVKLMRQKIIDAAKSGDVNNLKPLLGTSSDPTQLSVSDTVKDPIAYIKQLSGDGDGLETMAIMIDLLNSGYVHLDEEDNEEIYVWPYFVAMPIDNLSKQQLVELFQIMTAGDLEQMKEIGTYSFFRIGITPDGKWRFFITGD